MSRIAAALSGLLLAGSCGISALGLVFGPDSAELSRLPDSAWHPADAFLIEESRSDPYYGILLFSSARVDRVYGTAKGPLEVRRAYFDALAARGWILDPRVIQSDADPGWNWWCLGPYSYFLLIEGLGHPYGLSNAGFGTVFDSGTTVLAPASRDCPAPGVREPLPALVVIGSFVLFMLVAQVARARNIRTRGPSLQRAGGIGHYAAYLAFVPYLVIALHLGPELVFPDTVRWIGVAVAIAGVVIAIWSIAALGRNYDLELAIHSKHELIRSGPYQLVRHPVYTALIFHFIGACLATGNLLLAGGTVAVTIPAFVARARAEERLLREEFGAEYGGYVEEVPMLVPGLRGAIRALGKGARRPPIRRS
jgi:protein-S-isoprenylcysteine O-methyltransferase Ste14